MRDLIASLLPDNPLVVEAGAKFGTDTAAMARLWPRGFIHAFEPVPALYEIAARTLAGLKNVRLSQQALSDRTGTAVLHVSSGRSRGSSSLLPPLAHREVHPDILFEETVAVRTVTLDDWADAACVDRLDLLWLDAQGSEPRILAACPRLLAGVRLIRTEVSLLPMYEGVMLYPEYRAWLEARGFAVVREELPWPDMGDVLFARRETA